MDTPEVQQIKGLIRRGEARAAGRDCGVPYENLHFLDLPFYETGTVRKKPLGEEDVRIVAELLEKIRPHQVYAAGDLSDPHGTHRVCLAAVFKAMERLKDRDVGRATAKCGSTAAPGRNGSRRRSRWPCRSSPQELMRKRSAIFKHQSQKDKAMFPGADEREFWQRAEERNRQTARLYDKLGLAEYEAIEGFVRWRQGW